MNQPVTVPAAANRGEVPSTDRQRRVELKYLVTPEQADLLRQWAATHLAVDPHCPAGSEGYRITSLYLDTPALDIYHQRSEIINRKHRLRRYGNEATVWLETKRKKKSVVRKRRTALTGEQLSQVWQTAEPGPEWTGDWFRQRVSQAQLRPTALVRYDRRAWQGESSTGTVRLTLDRNLTGQPATEWHLPEELSAGIPLLPGAEILELKFNDILPPLFRRLLLEQSLHPGGFSKYRTALAAGVEDSER